MTCIYIAFILSFELMIMAFLFIFQVFPGKNYMRKKTNIQFICFLFSFILIVISVLESSGKKTDISEINSLFDKDFLMIFVVLCGICLIASMYKVIYSRRQNEANCTELELEKDEYRIVRKLDFLLGPLLYMPHVKAYALNKNKTIIFSNSVPEENQKLILYCNDIGNGVYDCFAYSVKGKKNGISVALNGIFNCVLIITVGYLPLLLVKLDRLMISEGNVDSMQTVFLADVMLVFGCVIRNVFYHNESVFGKIFFALGHVIVILGLGYLFNYLFI